MFVDGTDSEADLVTSAALSREGECGMSHRGGPSDFTALLSMADAALERAEMMPGREYSLRLTPFTESCTREWVRRHGRKFNCKVSGKRASRPVPTRSKPPRPGTDAAVRAGQKRALEQRVQAASGPRANPLRSVFGRAIDGRALSGSSIPQSKKFKELKALTVYKRAASAKQQRMRRAGRNPYPVAKSR